MVKSDLNNLILENEHAKALFEDYFREGHCTIVLKKHKISVSEIDLNEYKSIYELIIKVSKALEKKYNCEKTYLLSIGDQVEHIHFHLIPKHKDKCSMGEYCFIKLFEAEGKRNTPASQLHILANEIRSIVENPHVHIENDSRASNF
jgi:diadenosine tetraphosphate (Ap4A) HIT family hydrolase